MFFSSRWKLAPNLHRLRSPCRKNLRPQVKSLRRKKREIELIYEKPNHFCRSRCLKPLYRVRLKPPDGIQHRSKLGRAHIPQARAARECGRASGECATECCGRLDWLERRRANHAQIRSEWQFDFNKCGRGGIRQMEWFAQFVPHFCGRIHRPIRPSGRLHGLLHTRWLAHRNAALRRLKEPQRGSVSLPPLITITG